MAAEKPAKFDLDSPSAAASLSIKMASGPTDERPISLIAWPAQPLV